MLTVERDLRMRPDASQWHGKRKTMELNVNGLNRNPRGLIYNGISFPNVIGLGASNVKGIRTCG